MGGDRNTSCIDNFFDMAAVLLLGDMDGDRLMLAGDGKFMSSYD